jgi:flagellar hook protein FlgE
MIRSMFTAISSLNAHQAWMDVTGNNLTNVNTPGYKSQKVSFQDQISQILRSGAAPSGNLGGLNPTQIGLGMRLGGIGGTFTQGALLSTGRLSDLAIQGDGFFIYKNASGAPMYSRDGSVDIDAEGYLTNTTTGLRLQGWVPLAVSGSTALIDTGQNVQDLQVPVNSTLARATAGATIRGNLQADWALGVPAQVTIAVFDSQGQPRTATLSFTHSAFDNNWTWTVTSGSATGSGTVTFTSMGTFASATGGTSGCTGTVTFDALGGANPVTVEVDFSNLTQFATENSAYMSYQDGLGAGSLTGYNVESNSGKVFALYSNGLTEIIGQIAMATFTNPSGLIRVGQNLYQEGLNSGQANRGMANTGGRGTIIAGNLEASNVDVAQEFTNMILAQRGFQASSRVITTSDEMLQELVNLKR